MEVGLVKDLAETLAAVMTAFGIGAAGTWTYLLFVKQRQRYPSAVLEQKVVQKQLSPQHRLVHVAISVRNSGTVLLSLRSAEARLQQVTPVPETIASSLERGEDPVLEGNTEIEWPLIDLREWSWAAGEAEVEPGEAEILDADFVVPADVSSVELYAYVKNESKKKREIGWSRTTIHELIIEGESDVA